MSFGLAHAAMMAAMAAVLLPPIIHLLSRRRVPTVDWGAMMFLDPGKRARTRIRLAEILLMAARMGLLAMVALAAARPFLRPSPASAAAGEASASGTAGPRDVVLVIDGSESAGRKGPDGTSPRSRAIGWARGLVRRLRPGDTVAIVDARARPRAVIDPPVADPARAEAALDALPAPRGAGDLPSAVSEALRLLERSRNPSREVIVLTDEQRAGWRPDEDARWALLRDLSAGLSPRPRVWAVRFPSTVSADSADGSVGALEVPRSLVSPGAPVEVSATIANAGPAPLTRTVELLRDGKPEPGSSRTVGPIPPGGQSPVSFRLRLDEPGSHVLTVRLSPDEADPQVSNDESSRPMEAVEALPVLLIDGEPSREPLSGEVDFLRAALAPRDDQTPLFSVAVATVDGLTPEALADARVLVLANVDRLTTSQAGAVAQFLADGRGVLVAPGDRTDAEAADRDLYRGGEGWLPASIGEVRGDFRGREAVAHPDPSTFVGPVFAPLARGDAPPLSTARFFAYRVLEPAGGSSVSARLDTGEPWVVERESRGGRVALMSTPLDAEAGTLPVNPDFVPMIHELIFRLASPSTRGTPVASGSDLVFELDQDAVGKAESLELRTPSGEVLPVAVERSGGRAVARYAGASEPGLYRLGPEGRASYAVVLPDPSESDPTPLSEVEAQRLAEGWPMEFSSPESELGNDLAGRLLSTGNARVPRPLWRWLVLAAMGGLCVELVLTRRMSRGGVATVEG